MLAGTCRAQQSFNFSCDPPIVFTETNDVWSTTSCPAYSYSIEYKNVASAFNWVVTYYGFTQNNYIASTEQKAHDAAQTQIKQSCGI